MIQAIVNYLYKPWMAPANILKQAGVVIGKNYPTSIFQLDVSRNKALVAYKKFISYIELLFFSKFKNSSLR